MEQAIEAGGVSHVATVVNRTSTLSTVIAYIHHELPPERIAELEALVEALVIRSVTTWAKS